MINSFLWDELDKQLKKLAFSPVTDAAQQAPPMDPAAMAAQGGGGGMPADPAMAAAMGQAGPAASAPPTDPNAAAAAAPPAQAAPPADPNAQAAAAPAAPAAAAPAAAPAPAPAAPAKGKGGKGEMEAKMTAIEDQQQKIVKLLVNMHENAKLPLPYDILDQKPKQEGQDQAQQPAKAATLDDLISACETLKRL